MTATIETGINASPRRGPEWGRHVAGKAMAERDARRAALTWLDELALLYPPR